MQADYSIELGPDDATLDFPWAAPQPGPVFLDLRQTPSAITGVAEAILFPELAEFLTATNAQSGILQTAKCDVWFTTEITPEDEFFGLPGKFGGYVDLVFASAPERFSFADHEQLATRVVELLKRVPEIPSSAEFLVRRCYFDGRDGFYLTMYCFGFGTSESAARRQWAIALKLVENALRQAHPSGSQKQERADSSRRPE